MQGLENALSVGETPARGTRNGLTGKEEGLFSVAFYLFNILESGKIVSDFRLFPLCAVGTVKENV